jgi:hypothetical protein
MRYIEGLITESEEQRLVAFIEGLPLGLDFARSGPDRIGKSKPFAQTRNRIRLGFQRIVALFDHLVCCEQQFTGLRGGNERDVLRGRAVHPASSSRRHPRARARPMKEFGKATNS